MTVTLSYKSQGAATGSPVVILHGLLGASSNWRSIARQLCGEYRVFTLDLRNHGESPHVDAMSYPAMAADVIAFLDQHGLDTATIIGHSMGGKTAMRLALDAPERVTQLVVVDIAPTLSRHDHVPWLRAMADMDLHRVKKRSDAEHLLESAVPDAAMRGFLLQNLTSSAAGFTWRVNLEAIEKSLPALLDFPVDANTRPFTGPTLFVRGAQSDYVAEKDQAAIHALFPRAQMVTIEDAGHWVHAEQPGRFLESLKKHLAKA